MATRFLSYVYGMLLIPVFVVIASTTIAAQTPTPTPADRTPNDDAQSLDDYGRRRIAPTVGSGGSIGGPTGLFTIIDGKTLKKHDFTFSFSNSRYSRDPGNADFNQVQYTFNFGVTDRFEAFYSMYIFRGVRINAPPVLSGFYLPNSSVALTTNQTSTPAAMVLAPFNNRGVTGLLFRPINNQPLTAFPFIGQPSGNFGIGGLPPFAGTLGISNPQGGAFGPAASFPGIGSVFGSLLPGIVQTTAVTAGVTTPQNFTNTPAYLPEAPFIGLGSGRAWLPEFTIGAKIRFRKGEQFTNFGIVPFYRFYPDNANSGAGFRALQNGASPGGNLGDFGIIGFVGSRISPHVNFSANAGVIVNSNPTSTLFGSNKVTLLDRPNEYVFGAAVDFPMYSNAGDNHPIIELRGTRYFGSRTPNAFENHPVELVVGNRYYLPFNIGSLDNIGVAVFYRRQLNSDNNLAAQNAPGFPANGSSDQSNGLNFQVFFGRDRFIELPPDLTGGPVPLPQPGELPLTRIILGCPTGEHSESGSCPLPKSNPQQAFVARFTDLTGKEFPFGEGKNELRESLLRWEATGGRIIGPSEGTRQIRWDLTGVGPGNYELRALYPKYKLKNRKRVRQGDYVITFLLPIKACTDCIPDVVPVPCPDAVRVENPDSVDEGTEATFTARVINPPADANITYSWSVSPGRIIGRSDTQSITVDTTGLGAQTVTATVQLGGLDPRCATSANGDVTVARGETSVKVRTECKLFDSYGAIKYNDEKARLDNLAIQLREPGIEAYIVTYRGFTNPRIGNIGTSKLRVVGDVCGEYRYKRAFDYLVSDRGVEEARIKNIDGGSRAESSVELWICPSNKQPQVTRDTSIVSPGPCIDRGVPVRVTPRSIRTTKRRR